MAESSLPRPLRFCAVACLAVFSLAASEHHGIVKFGSIAVPGATVTVSKEDKKVVTVTDEAGVVASTLCPEPPEPLLTVRIGALLLALGESGSNE